MVTIESSPDMAAKVYETMERNLAIVRRRLGRPLTLADKVLLGHLDDPEHQDMEAGKRYLSTATPASTHSRRGVGAHESRGALLHAERATRDPRAPAHTTRAERKGWTRLNPRAGRSRPRRPPIQRPSDSSRLPRAIGRRSERRGYFGRSSITQMSLSYSVIVK